MEGAFPTTHRLPQPDHPPIYTKDVNGHQPIA